MEGRSVNSLTADDILNWFKVGTEVPVIEVRGGSNRLPIAAPEIRPKRSYQTTEVDQKSYVKEFLEKSDDVANNEETTIQKSDPSSKMFEIDEESNLSSLPNLTSLRDENSTDVYKNYNFNHVYNPNMIATSYKDIIVPSIAYNKVVIIEGVTGSGKTTQVPQFILDYHRENNTSCNIIVSQPRRIAAISNARRVCAERDWTLGGLVGYHVGLDKRTSRDTRLTYATTGVLLEQLVSNKNMDNYTHVILDEIHERAKDMDFCILIVRKFLHSVSPSVKVVLMSATFSVEKFADYFRIPIHGRLENPLVISLLGTSYPVGVYWLTDLAELGELPEINYQQPMVDDKTNIIVLKLIKEFDKMEMEEQKCSEGNFAPKRGAVLIFLPGLEEINRLMRVLNDNKSHCNWWCVPLHSTITTEEQSQVFRDPEDGYRKIILSTNIAESSITVPDIVYVIDYCLTKNLKCDMQTNYTHLQMEWASKANCTQRKGRTGRVASGRVYRLVPKEFYDLLPEYSDPEMQRCPLEQIVLKVKSLDIGEPRAILALCLDPPNVGDIERTVLVLKEVGALDITCNGKVNLYDGDLTFVGRVLESLPTDIRVGKLMIYGFLFGCLEQCIIIASGLSTKSIFSKPFKEPLAAYTNKLAWSNRSFSDCIAILLAYQTWQKKNYDRCFITKNNKTAYAWARSNFIQIGKIKEMETLVKDLTDRLERFNIKKVTHPLKNLSEAEEMLILKIVLAGAFYPNYFIRRELDDREIARTTHGKDPFTTVVLNGLPQDQGVLYGEDIEAFFKDFECPFTLHFEDSKAFVEFLRPHSSESKGNEIIQHVYSAIKMRQLRIPLEIYLLKQEEIARQLSHLSLIQMQNSGKLRTNRITTAPSLFCQSCQLPDIDQCVIEKVLITEVSLYGQIWAQYYNNRAVKNLLSLNDTITSALEETEGAITSVITPGYFCLAPYDNSYYRARVEAVQGIQIQVFFVDFGNVEFVSRDSLRNIDAEKYPELIATNALAFECVLAGIKPKHGNKWSNEAMNYLQTHVKNVPLRAEIYSVVQNVVRLTLIGMDESDREFNINDKLCAKGYAEFDEESYHSQHDHKLRKNSCADVKPQITNTSDHRWLVLTDKYSKNKMAHSNKTIKLRGPFSALETTFACLAKGSLARQVKIDPDSVNSVALDSEPYDKCDRMMVASSIGLNPSGEVIMARETTLLPNIHNLPALIAMIFAPRVDLRVNRNFSEYTGVLCGLGFDTQSQTPLYEEHDMEITFDTEMDDFDIRMVNSIRTHIAWCLKRTSGARDWIEESITTFQNPARNCLINLISRPRRIVEKNYFIRPHLWNAISPKYCQETKIETSYEAAAEESLIKMVKLTQTVDRKTRNHLAYLHWMANNTIDFTTQNCVLCGVQIENRVELKKHLMTKQHLKKAEIYVSYE